MADWVTDGYADNGVPRGHYEIPGMLVRESHLSLLYAMLVSQPI